MTTSKATIGLKLGHDKWFVYNALLPVLRYLEIKDLVQVMEVCTLWNRVALDRNLWHSLTVNVCDKHLASVADKFGDRIRNLTFCRYDQLHEPPRPDMDSVAESLRKMPHLKEVYFADMNGNQNVKLSILADNLNTNLVEQLHIHLPLCDDISLEFLTSFTNLTYFGVDCRPYKVPTLEALKNLKKITTLFVFDDEYFPYKDRPKLITLRNLCFRDTVICECFARDLRFIYSILNYLPDLLRIELQFMSIANYNFFRFLKRLPKIKVLVLHFSGYCRGKLIDFIKSLSRCKYIQVLEIRHEQPTLSNFRSSTCQSAVHNTMLLHAVLQMKETLTNLIWELRENNVNLLEGAWDCDHSIFSQKLFVLENMPLSVMSFYEFQTKLAEAMPKTQVSLVVKNKNITEWCFKCPNSQLQVEEMKD